MRLSKLSNELPVAPTRSNGVVHDIFWLFDLSELAPGRKLLINVSLSIVSLLPGKNDPVEYALAQRILTQNEMRVLLPLLDAPTRCQQAVLQASLCCTYELLLCSLFDSDAKIRSQWETLVKFQHDRLARAQEKRAQRAEMRGVYNALFTLRQKLEPFGLTIRSSRNGYYLALLNRTHKR